MTIADRLACLITTIVAVTASIAITILAFEGVSIPAVVPLVGGTQVIPGIIAARVHAATETMVTASENAAVAAALAKVTRDLASAERVTEDYRRRALASNAAKEIADAKLKQAEADDQIKQASSDTACESGGDRWTSDDLDWLQRHR